MRENLGQLTRLGIITTWQVETLETWGSTDWALRVKAQYRSPAGLAMTAMDFKIW